MLSQLALSRLGNGEHGMELCGQHSGHCMPVGVCRKLLREKEHSGNLSLEECLQLAKFICVTHERHLNT